MDTSHRPSGSNYVCSINPGPGNISEVFAATPEHGSRIQRQYSMIDILQSFCVSVLIQTPMMQWHWGIEGIERHSRKRAVRYMNGLSWKIPQSWLERHWAAPHIDPGN